MTKLKETLKSTTMNQDKAYARLSQSVTLQQNQQTNRKEWLRIAVMTFSLLALTIFATFYDGLGRKTVQAVSIVSIDINPSFQLKVDALGLVLEAKATNHDAQSIDVSDLVGWLATDAVKEIILRAQAAGFIDIEDDEEDYVLVTTAPVGEDDVDETDDLDNDLHDEFDDEDETDDVSVILMKATQQQAREAEGQKVPLGLYVINGMVQVGGELMSVSDFLKSEGNMDLLEPISVLIPRNVVNTLALIEKFLEKLETYGVDTTALWARLEAAGEDLVVLKTDVLAAWDALDKSDVVSGSTMSNSDIAKARVYLNRLIRELRKIGVDVNPFLERLNDENVDYASLESDLLAALQAAGIDVSTGSTVTDDDDDEDDDEDDDDDDDDEDDDEDDEDDDEDDE
jgi:hypothetical protein